MKYKEEVNKAMKILAEDPRVLFLGQTVAYPGSIIYTSLEGIPMDKRIELPVFEDTQMGISIGLSLLGYIPVSIYPRFDFLLLAVNQLVNHLDKIEEMSCGQYKPKVIIRTCIGSTNPLNPGLQHCQDYTEAFRQMLTSVVVVKLDKAKYILPSYTVALKWEGSTILVEVADNYNEK